MVRFGSQGEDAIGKWSEDKLELLRKYIHAYSVIMNKEKEKKKWLDAYYYVDAFSGSVQPVSKEDEKRYIEGSPLRALKTRPRFDKYYFIDIDQKRLERLQAISSQQEFQDCQIETYQGDCNSVLLDKVIPVVSRRLKRRAIAFLDPYGLNVNWSTIQALAQAGTFDLLINFSVMGVTRILPKDSAPTPENKEILNRVMGSSDWLDTVYQEPQIQQLDLLSAIETRSQRSTIDPQWLSFLYRQQLGNLFEHVSQPVLMKNSRNAALYSLCVASHNHTAVKITNDIFKRYERLKK